MIVATPFQNLGTVVSNALNSKRMNLNIPICLLYPSLHFNLNNDSEKKNQLDAQLINCIFYQPLHVSGISRPIIRRYNLCI